MKQALYLILYVAILVTVSCTGKGSLPFGERLLNRSAHTLAGLIASKTRLSHLLHTSFL